MGDQVKNVKAHTRKAGLESTQELEGQGKGYVARSRRPAFLDRGRRGRRKKKSRCLSSEMMKQVEGKCRDVYGTGEGNGESYGEED